MSVREEGTIMAVQNVIRIAAVVIITALLLFFARQIIGNVIDVVLSWF